MRPHTQGTDAACGSGSAEQGLGVSEEMEGWSPAKESEVGFGFQGQEPAQGLGR